MDGEAVAGVMAKARRSVLLVALGLLAIVLVGPSIIGTRAGRPAHKREPAPVAPTPTNRPFAVPADFAASGWIVIDAVNGDRVTAHNQKPWESQEPLTVLLDHVTIWAAAHGPEPLCPGMALQADGVWAFPGVIDATTVAIGYPHPACAAST
jgi:hypothetical protein